MAKWMRSDQRDNEKGVFVTRTIIVAIACLLAAACADSPSDSESDSETDTTTGAASGPAAVIDITGLSFGDPVTIGVGETVEVQNNDTVGHTWTSDDDLFDVSLDTGDTTTHTFDEAGEYSFVCTIHPGMTGTLSVEG